MEEMRDYKKLFDQYIEYEKKVHERNQKKIKTGLKVNLILPQVFLLLCFITKSSKPLFLILWVVSLFGIAFYLIYVEYKDYQIQMILAEKESDIEFNPLIGAPAERVEKSVNEKMDEIKKRAESNKNKKTNNIKIEDKEELEEQEKPEQKQEQKAIKEQVEIEQNQKQNDIKKQVETELKQDNSNRSERVESEKKQDQKKKKEKTKSGQNKKTDK